jgi:MFS family permease
MGGHFLQSLAYGSLVMLPMYLGALGASREQTGEVVATASIAGLLARPIIGWALDRFGRKPVLYAGTAALSAGMGSLLMVSSLGGWLWLSRVLVGVGSSALFTGYFAFVADLLPTSRRTEGIALFGISGLLPMLVNPLSHSLGIEALDLRWFFPVLGLLVAASALALFPLREERRPASAAPSRQEVLAALSNPALLPVFLATVALSSTVAAFLTFATVAAEARNIGNPTAIWIAYPLAAAGIRLFGARLPDRLGTSNMIAPSLGCYGAAMLIAAEARGEAGLLLAGALAGVAHGFAFPVLTSQVVTRVGPVARGSGMALFTAVWGLAEVVVSPRLGAVADAYDDATLFGAVALGLTVLLAIWALAEHLLAPPR